MYSVSTATSVTQCAGVVSLSVKCRVRSDVRGAEYAVCCEVRYSVVFSIFL